MNNKNYDELEKGLEKEELVKQKRKKKNMRVSGASVKQINKIIKEKNEK